MTGCKKISGKNRQVCIGSLDTLVNLYNRAITPPVQDLVDYTESFPLKEVVWANIQTTNRGEILFDRTNTARIVTHLFHIRYLDGVTAEIWIGANNVQSVEILYDVLSIENLDEKNDFILLKAAKRGAKSLPINQQ